MSSAGSSFRTLVGLRYRLLWAHARTGKGKIAIFLSLYAIGGMLLLFLALGGLAAGIAAVKMGQAETLARGVLTSVLVSGVFTSLVLGVGPRAAFGDKVLRRYPLSARQRFAARHLIGILDPLWLFLLAMTLGLAAGFAALGVCSALVAAPAAVLFIAVVYLLAALVLTLVERIMQFKGGEAILTGLMVTFFAGLGMLPLLMTRKSHVAWGAVDRVLRFTPAGTAAAVLAAEGVAWRALAALALIGWCALLFYALRRAENWIVQRHRREDERIAWDSWYDAVARWICPAHAALAAKALRYNLRCKRVKYQLVQVVPMVLFFELVFNRRHEVGQGIATLGWLFFAGIFSALAVAVNQFGYDGAGMRRYPLLPLPVKGVLPAHSRVSMFIGACALVPAILLWCGLQHRLLDVRGLLFAVCDAFGGLFLFHAAALWSSVLTPKRAEFDRVMGNDMSLGGNAILVAGMIAVFGTITPLTQRFTLPQVAAYWWIPGLILMLAVPAYLVSLNLTGRILESRRERMMETIAGAAAN